MLGGATLSHLLPLNPRQHLICCRLVEYYLSCQSWLCIF